jgi:hypothetical protein
LTISRVAAIAAVTALLAVTTHLQKIANLAFARLTAVRAKLLAAPI